MAAKKPSNKALEHYRHVIVADSFVISAISSLDKTAATLTALVTDSGYRSVLLDHELMNMQDIIRRCNDGKKSLAHMRRHRLTKATARAKEHLRREIST